MSGTDDLVVRVDELEPFALPRQGEPVYVSRCIFATDGVHSSDLTMNHGTVKAGKALKGGHHPAGCNEGYYVLRGRALLTLGGDPQTGEGGTTYEVEPGTAIYIPGGTFHKLHNPFDEDFELLTIWPQIPPPGANGVYDQRRQAWGTDFRKKASAAG